MPLTPKPNPTPPYQTDSKYEPRTTVPETPYGYAKTEKKSGCGCWFYGCFLILLIVLGILFAIFFGLRHVAGKIESLASSQTVTTQEDINKFSSTDYDRVLKKVESFLTTLSTAKGNPEITLNSDEINTLIAHHPELIELKGKFSVNIQNDIIKTFVSVPLDEFQLGGKFLNVQSEWKINFAKDVLNVFVKNIQIANYKLPSIFSQELENINIGEEIMSDPKNKKKLSDVEKIEVSQGKITIRIKKEALPISIQDKSSSETTA